MRHPHVNLFGMSLHEALVFLRNNGQNFGVEVQNEMREMREERSDETVARIPCLPDMPMYPSGENDGD